LDSFSSHQGWEVLLVPAANRTGNPGEMRERDAGDTCKKTIYLPTAAGGSGR
jgi:hypothetical protein